jgi:hypothetical protein
MLLAFRQVLTIGAERVRDEVFLLETIAKKRLDCGGNMHDVDLLSGVTDEHSASPRSHAPRTLPQIGAVTRSRTADAASYSSSVVTSPSS